MAEKRRSWLDGPQIPSEYDQPGKRSEWPGQNLGLPKEGISSVASVGRRAGGVAIDSTIAWILGGFTHMFITAFGVAEYTVFYYIVLGTLSVTLFARTPGQAVLGMGVARVDVPRARVGFLRAFLRTLMTYTIFLAAMVDEDLRGIHDRFTQTVVIRG